MAEGDGDYRIGSAYYEVHLRDQTQGDEAEIRSKVQGGDPVSLKTFLQDPANTESIKDRVKKSAPAELPLKAEDPIDEAWRQRIRESLKRTALESLQVHLTPESERWRADLGETLRQTEALTRVEIPAELDKRIEFKEAVQTLAGLASMDTRVRIPVEVDENEAQNALRDLTTKVDAANEKNTGSFKAMAASTGAVWAGLGALLAGPLVIGALGLTATAVSGIAIAAEKSTPQVTQAFQTMKTEGSDLLKNGFASMTPAITSALGTISEGMRAAQPELAALSSQLGPFLQTFAGTLVQVAQTTLPAFTQTLANAAPFAEQMARGIQELAVGVGNFFSHIDFSQASTAFQTLLSDVGQLLPVVANLVNAVMPLANALLTSVIPAATRLANIFIGDLAPAIHVIGSAISALGPVLNFMAGPTASVLTGVVAFKALGSATSGLLSVFNTATAGIAKLSSTNGIANESLTVMTDSMKKQAVAAASQALLTAQQTAQQAKANLETVEADALSGAATISEEKLTAARAAATAAARAETEATAALNTATKASSFSMGPMGIALGALAGVMTLFASNTKSDASPAVEDFTQKIKDLAAASPQAMAGILAADPALAGFVKQAQSAGISIADLAAALNGSKTAQDAVVGKLQASADAFGQQKVTIDGTTGSVKDFAGAVAGTVDVAKGAVGGNNAQVQTYQAMLDYLNKLKGQFGGYAGAQQQAAQATQLTTLQQQAASGIAQQFGLSVDSVARALSLLPGAGESGAEGVQKVTTAFDDMQVKFLNGEQTFTDYFKNLQKNADQANQSLASSEHSYAQSVTAVSDAEHSAAQAAQAVKTARDGVAAATRAVTDAEHSYADAQFSTAQARLSLQDAEAGVTIAENNLTKAQDAERIAQDNLTKAREQATEQLKSLHLQLNDQIASEQRAQISLFDQVTKASALGVTKDNAASILAQPLTAQNEALKKSALDLVDAENSLADTMNTGANLRKQVAQADQAGVEGSQQVVSAKQALRSATDQVTSSEQALLKSHQQVTQAEHALADATYAEGKAQQAIVDAKANVVKANQAVTDAVYNEKKAREAVKDAIFNEHQALLALKQAQDAAKLANDANTTSLDLNTQAGRNNWAQLQQLFGTYPQWWTDQQKFNQMIQDTADKFGMSRQAAFDFLQQEGKIPKTYTFDVQGMTTINMAPLANWANDKSGYFAGGFRSAGGAVAMATGGHVTGPGGPTDDLIDAKLSDGEFVQPADVVSHYGVGFMENLRQKRIPKFAKGGAVDQVALNLYAAGIGTGYEFIRNTEILAGADPNTLPQLPAYVPPTQGGGGGGPIPTGQHLAMIDAALSADGIPHSDWARWEAGLNVLIGRESSWNPNAINLTDSNARAGHPSQGLMQTIPSTFNAYRNPGLPGGITDPVANIAAGINYIIGRYNDISNVQQANPNLPPRGYALGDIVGTDGASLLGVMSPQAGIIPKDRPRLVGDNKRVPESYIPNDPGDPRAQQILTETNARMGRRNSGANVNVTINTSESDPDRIASLVSSRIGWAMRGV